MMKWPREAGSSEVESRPISELGCRDGGAAVVSDWGDDETSSSLPEINPDDLEPTIFIDLKTQKKILQLCAILDTADHYMLLGVPRTAEKKEIRTAYFDRMNLFHSDKFYGKNIGKFGPRLQKIVQTLTKASDVLSRNKTRAEYDAYLASRQTTLGARMSVAPLPPSSPPPEAVRAVRPAVAPIDVVSPIPRAPRAPQIGVQPNIDSPRAPLSPPPASPRSTDAARRLLARKMGHRGVPHSLRGDRPSAPPAAALDQGEVRKAVEADLRKRYDARVNPGKGNVDKYLTRAEEAVRAADWSAAVNAVKIAAKAAPDDLAVQRRMAEVRDLADRALAPKFLEQAKYEEKDGQFDRAARSYERAARGKNSADLFEKAASCLLRAPRLLEEDKRKLVELARKSVTLDNRSAGYRLTLARAYDVAGMRTSAQGEVRRALELEPNNKYAKELQKALK